MDSARIAEAATLLWQTRLAGRRVQALPQGLVPKNLAEGYAVQDAMVAIAGQEVAGWKIAATSKAGQRHIGVDEPLAGRLFAGFVLKDGAGLKSAPLHMRVVEAEFAFVMGRDLVPRAKPYSLGETRDAVAKLHLAIEIPDARFDRFAEIGAAQIAADDAFASWFVLGAEAHDWRDLDLPSRDVKVSRNGVLVAEGRGANALGDPGLALAWLANHLRARGPGLRAGDIVTTGTCVTPVAIGSGDHVIADFAGLGHVAVSFD